MNDTIQKLIEDAAEYQKPDFSFADLMTSLFVAPIADPISGPFIILIALIFVSALFPRVPVLNFFGSNAITILPALGILGTFVGVLVAVSNFDTSPEGIVQSLSVIMQGLKIAFSTSIFGLAGSIVLRFLSRSSSESFAEVGPEDILSEIQKGHSEARDHNKALISAISGDGDSSLNNQLKLMRQDLNDFAKTVAEANTTAFIEALKQAIADFNKNLTEQFGENFKRLNDAVGKLLDWQENNKKDMDLLRRTLDEFTNAAKSTSDSIQQIQQATASIPENVSGLANILSALDEQMKDIKEHVALFAEISEKAKSTLPEIQTVLEDYTNGLKTSIEGILTQVETVIDSQEQGFASLSDRYTEIANSIQASGTEITETFTSVSEQLSTSSEKARDSIVEVASATVKQNELAIKEHEQLTQAVIQNLQDRVENIVDESISKTNEMTSAANAELTRVLGEASQTAIKILEEHQESSVNLKSELEEVVDRFSAQFSQKLEASNESQQQILNDFAQRLGISYEETNSKLAEMTKDHFGTMQDQVDKILEREMQELASRLGAISMRIADDYGPLTDNIRKIVEIGKQDPDERN